MEHECPMDRDELADFYANPDASERWHPTVDEREPPDDLVDDFEYEAPDADEGELPELDDEAIARWRERWRG